MALGAIIGLGASLLGSLFGRKKQNKINQIADDNAKFQRAVAQTLIDFGRHRSNQFEPIQKEAKGLLDPSINIYKSLLNDKPGDKDSLASQFLAPVFSQRARATQSTLNALNFAPRGNVASDVVKLLDNSRSQNVADYFGLKREALGALPALSSQLMQEHGLPLLQSSNILLGSATGAAGNLNAATQIQSQNLLATNQDDFWGGIGTLISQIVGGLKFGSNSSSSGGGASGGGHSPANIGNVILGGSGSGSGHGRP